MRVCFQAFDSLNVRVLGLLVRGISNPLCWLLFICLFSVLLHLKASDFHHDVKSSTIRQSSRPRIEARSWSSGWLNSALMQGHCNLITTGNWLLLYKSDPFPQLKDGCVISLYCRDPQLCPSSILITFTLVNLPCCLNRKITMDPMSACCLQLSIIEAWRPRPDEKSSLYKVAAVKHFLS